jgi:ribosomal protein S18 acetylase RimI-like enzyme
MSLEISDSGRLPAGCRIRLADGADAQGVRNLDDLCFPLGSNELQRAEAGELEESIRQRDVLVLECRGSLLAYLQANTSTPGRIYVSGLGVHPAAQGSGLGSMVVEECLASLAEARRAGLAVVTVTSPGNQRMLRVLFKHGFAARWILRSFFGPDRHRFGLQAGFPDASPCASDPVWIPTANIDEVFHAVERSGLVARAVVSRRGEVHFKLTTMSEGEFSPCTPPLPGASAIE